MRRRAFLLAAPVLTATALAGGCSPAYLLDALVAPGTVERTEGIRFMPGPRGTLDVYRPEKAAGTLPVIVFLYGGGWKDGEKGIYAWLGRELAQKGAVVVVPDYRLYPEVRFPSFLEDNARAVGWVMRHLDEIGGDPRSVFVLGHSAGAYNAAMLGLDRRWLGAEGIGRRQLAGVIGLAGPYDFLPITDPDVIPVFPNAGADTQPITYADGGAPPMLLLAGTDDTTVKPRNTQALAARIEAQGGAVQSRIYPGVAHIGVLLAMTPMFRDKAPVERDIWDFVQARKGTGGAAAVSPEATPAAAAAPSPDRSRRGRAGPARR